MAHYKKPLNIPRKLLGPITTITKHAQNEENTDKKQQINNLNKAYSDPNYFNSNRICKLPHPYLYLSIFAQSPDSLILLMALTINTTVN